MFERQNDDFNVTRCHLGIFRKQLCDMDMSARKKLNLNEKSQDILLMKDVHVMEKIRKTSVGYMKKMVIGI